MAFAAAPAAPLLAILEVQRATAASVNVLRLSEPC